jgi:hypothetical protein
MNNTDEAWEEEQMSNLGCESVSDLITEVKRLRKELECWGKMLEIYGINNERMSAALSFAFGDRDCSMSYLDYLESMLSLSERDLDWYRKTHGDD